MELKKPRKVVEVKNALTMTQRKAYNCIMKHFFLVPKPQGEEYHSISVEELCDLIGTGQKNFNYLDDELGKMQSTLVEWAGQKEGEWKRVCFFSFMEYKDGRLYYDFHKELIKLMKDRRSVYNLIDLGSLQELTSKHSVALYELCSGYRETAKFPHGTGWRHLTELKYYLCGDSKAYPQFKDFNRDVLKSSIKEINKYTDINIEMLTQKKGRSVVGLKFLVKPKKNFESVILRNPTSELRELSLKNPKPKVGQVAPDEMLRELTPEEQKNLFKSQL